MKEFDEYKYSETPQAKYDKANTVYINLRLYPEEDQDLIDALEGKPKQTEVKKLVRLGMGRVRHDRRIEKEKREKRKREKEAFK